MIDELLKKYNLKYEDLNVAEKQTFNTMLSAMQRNQISIDSLREYITTMRDGVEEELCRSDLNTTNDIFLKARLRNYKLLEAFLLTPEKAKKQLEAALKGVS